MIIGLTGPSGGGKGEVSRLLAAKGGAVLDADAASREVMLPGGAAYAEAIAVFGRGIVQGGTGGCEGGGKVGGGPVGGCEGGGKVVGPGGVKSGGYDGGGKAGGCDGGGKAGGCDGGGKAGGREKVGGGKFGGCDGDGGITCGGLIDRAALGEIVFADAGKRRLLEQIVHKYVIEMTENETAALAERDPPPRFVVWDAPLLIEAKMDGRCDRVWVVTAPYELRLARIMARDGLDERRARLRLDSQTPERELIARADAVIVNDGDLQRLEERVGELLRSVFRNMAPRQ